MKAACGSIRQISTDSEEQLISLDAQKNHYEVLIRSRRDWEYAGLYYDEGISGTKMAKRDGLLSMLADCERGLIDYIIVKSISRFSRNTVESIETVRRLCSMGIYILFEKENIDTGKMEGELLLSILSSLAESESLHFRNDLEHSETLPQRHLQNRLSSLRLRLHRWRDGGNQAQSEIVKWISQRFFPEAVQPDCQGTECQGHIHQAGRQMDRSYHQRHDQE